MIDVEAHTAIFRMAKTMLMVYRSFFIINYLWYTEPSCHLINDDTFGNS